MNFKLRIIKTIIKYKIIETKVHEQYGPKKTDIIPATGGGAYKYANIVKEQLGITFEQHPEMVFKTKQKQTNTNKHKQTNKQTNKHKHNITNK